MDTAPAIIGNQHWDDYWFGMTHQFGDTFPHYWITILDVRARKIVANNLCLFRPNGQASCAYLYLDTVKWVQSHQAN